MQTLSFEHTAQYEVKRSKFLAYLIPSQHFESRLARLRAEHPKANHHVNAFRRLNDSGQIEEGFSDDGEPRGVAGMPTLRVLQGREMINVGIVTVRYFGGIKLGTGGMARAYSDAANALFDGLETEPFIPIYRHAIETAYPQLSRLEFLVGQYGDVTLTVSDYGAEGIQGVLCGRESHIRELLERFSQG